MVLGIAANVFLGIIVALLVFIVGVLILNKGLWYVVNILSQIEPAMIAIGAFIAWAFATPWSWFGVALITGGIWSRYLPGFNLNSDEVEVADNEVQYSRDPRVTWLIIITLALIIVSIAL